MGIALAGVSFKQFLRRHKGWCRERAIRLAAEGAGKVEDLDPYAKPKPKPMVEEMTDDTVKMNLNLDGLFAALGAPRKM
jgi:hypothetical protein